MAFIGVDHVVIRVKDREEAVERYRALGLELSTTTENPAVGKVAIFRLADGFFLELLDPLSPDSPLWRALASRCEGVHRIALAVDDLEASVNHLQARGAPIIRADGLPLAFIPPKPTPGAAPPSMARTPSRPAQPPRPLARRDARADELGVGRGLGDRRDGRCRKGRSELDRNPPADPV